MHTQRIKMIRKRITIILHQDFYHGLMHIFKRHEISQFLNDFAQSRMMQDNLVAAYQTMGADLDREREAIVWSNALIGDVNSSEDVIAE
jgi:hypothetical protein